MIEIYVAGNLNGRAYVDSCYIGVVVADKAVFVCAGTFDSRIFVRNALLKNTDRRRNLGG